MGWCTLYRCVCLLVMLLLCEEGDCAKKKSPEITEAKLDRKFDEVIIAIASHESRSLVATHRLFNDTDTVIGTMNVKLDYVVDSANGKTASNISAPCSNATTRTNTVAASELATRLDGVDTEINSLQTSIADIDAKISALEVSMTAIAGKLDTLLQGALSDVGSSATPTVLWPLPRSDNPKDCYDIMQLGHTSNGLYTIYLDYMTVTLPTEVYCDMESVGGAWVVFQRRQDGAVDFYRNWDDYKFGFGDKTAEFWLGNENLHLLTSQREYEVRFDLWDQDGVHIFAQYKLFSIGPAEQYYKVHFCADSYSGTAGDGFGHHNNAGFSTKDDDNDTSGSHCAVTYKGAWWYNACAYSNLNGHYGASDFSGVAWYKNAWELMKKTEIKLRPINAII